MSVPEDNKGKFLTRANSGMSQTALWGKCSFTWQLRYPGRLFLTSEQIHTTDMRVSSNHYATLKFSNMYRKCIS